MAGILSIMELCKSLGLVRLIGAGTAYLLMTLIFGSLNAFNDRAVAHIASLAITRALLRKPEIPLLDDATSELNFESQIQVADAMRKVAKGGTMIHVTHRVGVMKGVDVVFVMERGRVVESGQYEELIASGGKLRDMIGEIVSQA
ncbi:uncharacterized protein PAC_14112 [Phialocephala subalpina]|uniref:ABC transporter domain-containing protein n=1 Tax=Phialocephala subalpina TaxID=576137 RepID=A0A1L7XGR8_9HELO|nr:uncharacterized protein PAC_14112 [Phialocephala subalpina]